MLFGAEPLNWLLCRFTFQEPPSDSKLVLGLGLVKGSRVRVGLFSVQKTERLVGKQKDKILSLAIGG